MEVVPVHVIIAFAATTSVEQTAGKLISMIMNKSSLISYLATVKTTSFLQGRCFFVKPTKNAELILPRARGSKRVLDKNGCSGWE